MLVELWDLMETPTEEQKVFSHVTRLSSASADEVSTHGCLSSEVIEQVKLLDLNLVCNVHFNI